MDRVAVVGCGKVGFTFMEWLAASGHDVLGYDIDRSVRRRISDVFGRSAVCAELADVNGAASVHLCVPTEPASDGSADISVVTEAAKELAELERQGAYFGSISQRSTCPPGTADRLANLFIGVPYGVNPSFIRKATVREDTFTPERVALGGPQAYIETMMELYRDTSGSRFITQSRPVVELLKYAENAIDSVLISAWNELLAYAVEVGIEANDFCGLVDNFSARAKFSSSLRVPGQAFGMWCLPKDLNALIKEMRDKGVTSHTFEGARSTNSEAFGELGEGSQPGSALFNFRGGRIRLTPVGRDQVRQAFHRKATKSRDR
jgi:nucleotide sugar dehydrogenase